MKQTTRAIIRAALESDDSISVEVREEILALLDGKVPRDMEGPLLLNMTDAARKLGMGRTWFWEQVTADRTRSEKWFPRGEVSPGEFRYRRTDLEAYVRRIFSDAPKPPEQKNGNQNGA